MLRFLFSFCGAKADAPEVERKEEDILAAFKKVRELTTDPKKLPRGDLSSA